jgi:hypothetical protein
VRGQRRRIDVDHGTSPPDSRLGLLSLDGARAPGQGRKSHTGRDHGLRRQAGECGRIAFCTTSGPAALPVNFAMVAGTIVVRTGEGTAVDGHAGERVAFEVDHIDDALSQGWSVLVRGQAHRVEHPAELEIVRRDAAIWPWPGGDRDVYVRIIPDTITGRRIEIR